MGILQLAWSTTSLDNKISLVSSYSNINELVLVNMAFFGQNHLPANVTWYTIPSTLTFIFEVNINHICCLIRDKETEHTNDS